MAPPGKESKKGVAHRSRRTGVPPLCWEARSRIPALRGLGTAPQLLPRLRPPRRRPFRRTRRWVPRGPRRSAAASSPHRPGCSSRSLAAIDCRTPTRSGAAQRRGLHPGLDSSDSIIGGDDGQGADRPIRSSAGNPRTWRPLRRRIGSTVPGANSISPAAWRSRRVRRPTICSPRSSRGPILTECPLVPTVVSTRHWSLRIWTSCPGGSGDKVTRASRGTTSRICLHSST